MFGCFRKGDANDPEIYVSAVAAILSEYPDSVIDYVTDPRTGLPRRSKWLPQPSEVADACDEQMVSARRRLADERILNEQMALRNVRRPSHDERERVSGGFAQLSEKLKAIVSDEATGEKLPTGEENAA